MARRQTSDPTIGERIRVRRQLRGWSIRYAADRAGLSHSTLSRIEKGRVSVDNRFTIAGIAAALECPVAELTGQPGTPADRDAAAARAAAPAILQALIETDLSQDPTTTPRPIEALEQEAALIGTLRLGCDYTRAARLLPPLLRETHAATRGPDRQTALRLLARTADTASFVVRYIGYPVESYLAAKLGRQAAEALEDPVILGLTTWSLIHAATGCGAYGRALTLAEREADTMQRHVDASGGAEMLGQLFMSRAFAAYATGQRGDAQTWIRRAVPLAERTGDSHKLGLMFGPTNIRLWQISMETDGGEPGRAVEIARDTDPAAAGMSISRQVAFWSDTARALGRLRQDREAVRMLLHAERLSPLRVHSSPLIQEAARALLDRAQRRAGGRELRGLCERMGLAR
jgi:transcriptional regulator with XRE-family HTH domain